MRKAEVAMTAVRDGLATQSAPAQRANRKERKRDMISEYHLRKMIEVGIVGADVEQLRAMLRVLVGEPAAVRTERGRAQNKPSHSLVLTGNRNGATPGLIS